MNRPQIAARALRRRSLRACRRCRASSSSRSRQDYKKNYAAVCAFNQAKVISILKGQGLHRVVPTSRARATTRSSRARTSASCRSASATTTGNQLRALTFEIIQRQLKSVGIELVPRFQTGGRHVRHDAAVERLGPHACSRGSRLAVARRSRRRTATAAVATRTYGNYCNKKASALLNKTATDARRRPAGEAAQQRRELKYMVKDVPSIPDVRSAGLHDRREEGEGPDDSDDAEGDLWNVNSGRQLVVGSIRHRTVERHSPAPAHVAGAGRPTKIRRRGTMLHLRHPQTALQHRRPRRWRASSSSRSSPSLRRSARGPADRRPNVSEQTVQNIIDAQAPRRPDLVRYGYWVKDAVTNQFGTTLLDEPADPARPLAGDEEHAAARHRRASSSRSSLAVGIGVYSALTAVLVVRLHGDDASASSASRRRSSGSR